VLFTVGSSVSRGVYKLVKPAVYATTKLRRIGLRKVLRPQKAQGMTFSNLVPVPAQGGVAPTNLSGTPRLAAEHDGGKPFLL